MRYLIKPLLICTFLFFSSVCFAQERLVLATTTSTENSGLLQILLPPFEQQNNIQVHVIAVGTGQAIKIGERGDADILMVHAKAQEEAFVAAGFGVERFDLMYNDFVILGPTADPAGINESNDAVAAFNKIVASGVPFVSRADMSGTHIMEKQLWQMAGIEPQGRWYVESGRGMGEVIQMTTEMQGYTLADRGTYLAYLGKTDLIIVVAGDERLFNPYGVIAVNPQRHPHVNKQGAEALIDYLTGQQARDLIRGFSINGQQLFFVYD